MEETATERSDLLPVKALEPVFKIGSPAVRKYLKDNRIATQLFGRSAYLERSQARKAIEIRGVRYQPRTLSLQMLKGGVGKTTIAYYLGIRAHMYGARVLLIDLDGQANLTSACGVEAETGGFIELLETEAQINDIIVRMKPGFHLVPSSLDNADLEKSATKVTRNVAEIVRMHLRGIRELYDLIIIDTAPSLSTINAGAACASDLVLIPVMPDKFSYYGLEKTMADLEGVKKDFKEGFNVSLVFNRFDSREKTSKALLEQLSATLPERMTKTYIRTSSELKNRIFSGENLFSFGSTATADFDALTREVLGWL
jgi:chromosome partitioning protein